jgi:hypothetical protein
MNDCAIESLPPREFWELIEQLKKEAREAEARTVEAVSAAISTSRLWSNPNSSEKED